MEDFFFHSQNFSVLSPFFPFRPSPSVVVVCIYMPRTLLWLTRIGGIFTRLSDSIWAYIMFHYRASEVKVSSTTTTFEYVDVVRKYVQLVK